jgi:hypothetical protein
MNILSTLILVLLACGALQIYTQSSQFQLKCIISDVDRKRYCVRDRIHLSEAADLLATCTSNLGKLVRHCAKEYPKKAEVIRMVNGYNPTRIQETLPTSELTAYSENKGEVLAFCLNKHKNGGGGLIDLNTLTFVAIHELAHVATKSVGHTPEFWNNFKFLLIEAKKIDIYNPVDYRQSPKHYCGLDITDNPYFTPG